MQVQAANSDIITSTAIDKFPFENVPSAVCVCHKFLHLANHILSVGQLCDSNMIVLLDANYVYIFNQLGKEILQGQRHPLSKLYMILLLRDINNTTVLRQHQ